MSRLFKIAMIAACPFPHSRGTPVRILRMAESLANRGHEIHVVTYHLGEKLQRAPFYLHRIRDVKTYRKYSPGPTYQKLLVLDMLLLMNLFHVLKSYEIDLIHAHHYEGLFVASLVRRWTKHPLVYDAHTLLESELPFYSNGLSQRNKQFIGLRLDSWLPKWADHIISVTDGIKDKLIAQCDILDEQISVIKNGVEINHFQSITSANRAKKEKGNTLIYTGNFASYQGIDLMLQAFKVVLDRRQDVDLLIVSNSDFSPYKNLADQLGIQDRIEIRPIDFSGLPACLATSDIALNPRTDCDGLPQKLLNYMAAGKPIVSFEGSAKGLEHGKNGWVVENSNIDAFAQGVIYLLDNQQMAQKLGAEAVKIATSDYTWEKTAERVEVVYRNLLERVD